MSKTNILSFRYKEEDLENQLKNYSTLKITESARGAVVLFFGTLNIFSIVFVYFFDLGISVGEVLLEIIVLYVPLLFYVYRGYRWAIVAIMIVWTLDKAYTLYFSWISDRVGIGSIIFLVLGLSICSMALQVENRRQKAITPE